MVFHTTWALFSSIPATNVDPIPLICRDPQFVLDLDYEGSCHLYQQLACLLLVLLVKTCQDPFFSHQVLCFTTQTWEGLVRAGHDALCLSRDGLGSTWNSVKSKLPFCLTNNLDG